MHLPPVYLTFLFHQRKGPCSDFRQHPCLIPKFVFPKKRKNAIFILIFFVYTSNSQCKSIKANEKEKKSPHAIKDRVYKLSNCSLIHLTLDLEYENRTIAETPHSFIQTSIEVNFYRFPLKRTQALGLRMEDGVAMPEDVLIEILVNLPVKSLMRFKCVSKYWRALIKGPNFVSRHLKRDCNEIVLLKRMLPQPSQGTNRGERCEILSFHDPDSLDLLVSPNLPLPQFLDNLVGSVFYDYMGTCNGLVCLGLSETVVLCNPALREFELLPPSPFGIPEGYVSHAVVMGFGFDAITDAYKIVQLVSIVNSEKDYPENFEDASVRIDLYNSSTNSWRLIDAVVPQFINDSGFNLFFNGACHWHSFSDRSDSDGDYSYGVLSLNLSTEVFQHFELPDFEDEKLAGLGALNQGLALLRFGGGAYDSEFIDIWVMKEYGVKESWTKEFVIGPYAFDYPLLLLKNEWLLMVTIDYQMVSCALHDNEIKNLHFEGKDWSLRAVNFKESLVSLKKVILCGKKDRF